MDLALSRVAAGPRLLQGPDLVFSLVNRYTVNKKSVVMVFRKKKPARNTDWPL